MTTYYDQRINILDIFHSGEVESWGKELLHQFVTIGVFLSKGPSSEVIDALKLLEEDIKKKASSGEPFNLRERGMDILRECLKDWEVLDGFVVPERAPTYIGFVTHTPFMQALKDRMHWEDLGAGKPHGRYTHRLQWYAIGRSKILGTQSGDVFSALGQEKFKVTNPAVAKQMIEELGQPRDLTETIHGTALWDVLCDRIEGKKFCEPESDTDFRHPKLMNTWIKEQGAANGLPLLSAILNDLGNLHPESNPEKLADQYALRVYGKSAKTLGEGFLSAFEKYYDSASAGLAPASITYDPKSRGSELFGDERQKAQWRKSGGSDCYITTATCRALGLPDDCHELQALRRFRDDVLLRSRQGRAEVDLYYQTAPRIVQSIDAGTSSNIIYRYTYSKYIQPAVAALGKGDLAQAHLMYRTMLDELIRRFC